MTNDERTQILVTARLLQAARNIHWLTMGLILIAAFHPTTIAAVASAILGLTATVFNVRLAFDAYLLKDIAAGRLATSEFDDAAVALRLRPARKSGRPWNDRCRGAKRLLLISAALTSAQALVLLISR